MEGLVTRVAGHRRTEEVRLRLAADTGNRKHQLVIPRSPRDRHPTEERLRIVLLTKREEAGTRVEIRFRNRQHRRQHPPNDGHREAKNREATVDAGLTGDSGERQRLDTGAFKNGRWGVARPRSVVVISRAC